MKKQEIIKHFKSQCLQEIASAMEYKDDEYFQKVYDLFNCSEGYGWFFPIAKPYRVFQSNFHFPNFCQMYNYLDWCISDDGHMSMVCVKYKSDMSTKGGSYRFFVMNGYHEELELDEIAKITFKNTFGEVNWTIIDYVAAPFDGQGINFLHGLLHPMADALNVAKDYKNREDLDIFFDFKNDQLQKIRNYIESQEEKKFMVCDKVYKAIPHDPSDLE